VSFDWAMKKLLRQKVNFDVLEGFLSTLLEFDVKIHSILESESNPENEFDKNNKLDILCEDSKKRLIFIEVQYLRQTDFFHRILFGSSKLLTNYMEKGRPYEALRKVYSINILYFDLGQGLVSLPLNKYGKVAVDFCSDQGVMKEQSRTSVTEEQRRAGQKDQDLVYNGFSGNDTKLCVSRAYRVFRHTSAGQTQFEPTPEELFWIRKRSRNIPGVLYLKDQQLQSTSKK
jgi:hypothetical protein